MPSPPSSSGPTAVSSAAVVKELLAREGELTQREEALAAREEKARISEKALPRLALLFMRSGPRLRLPGRSTLTR
jgi:hypothetical protein